MSEWMQIAKEEIGVTEGKFGHPSPRILEYLKICDSLPSALKKTDGTPWCAAFVSWVLEQAGYKSLLSPWAASYKNYGIPSGGLYGDLVVFKKHVGFVVFDDGYDVFCLGGNQGNSVSIHPYPKTLVKTFRRPTKDFKKGELCSFSSRDSQVETVTT